MNKIVISDVAWGQFQALTVTQQEQARRLMRAIQIAPLAGRPWNRDTKNRLHWIVSASDTHLVYRVAYRHDGDTLMITAILVYETQPDPNNLL